MRTEEFAIRLGNVPDSYYDFIVGVLNYVKKKESRLIEVTKYMDKHPDATTSDIIEFISDQPDFYEDAAYSHAEVV